MSNSLDIIARLARGDVNMPNYVGFPFEMQGPDVEFEAAVYSLLRSDPVIVVSRLFYYRVPIRSEGPKLSIPKDITGRRLFLFERAEGEKNVWEELGPDDKTHLVTQSAHIRASLFNLNLPSDFVSEWFLKRVFGDKPEVLPIPVSPTREFFVAFFMSKIEATIKNIGDKIGWKENNLTVGPITFAAKQSLLRLVPHIMPKDGNEASLYRFVLDHGDYGIHNMSITTDESGHPLVTSLYDWEVGCVTPAIISDPTMEVYITLLADENASPAIDRFEDDARPEDHVDYMIWSKQYFKTLYEFAPDYEHVIRAGKDARHLWFALRDWQSDDAEDYFGELGNWAERRMKELGITTD
ncbi:hypothetical protein C0989_006195 [Termitomyces sp. Mn162]|nr:hypothetical protein C0989_006195 [Termitomyces sp. Mn162]